MTSFPPKKEVKNFLISYSYNVNVSHFKWKYLKLLPEEVEHEEEIHRQHYYYYFI